MSFSREVKTPSLLVNEQQQEEKSTRHDISLGIMFANKNETIVGKVKEKKEDKEEEKKKEKKLIVVA